MATTKDGSVRVSGWGHHHGVVLLLSRVMLERPRAQVMSADMSKRERDIRSTPSTATSLFGCLFGWVALLLAAAGICMFFGAVAQLITVIRGDQGDSIRPFPTPVAVYIAVGVPAVLDLVLRLAGRKRVARRLPVSNNDQLARDAGSFGTRPVPAGLQELAFVPLLLLIPVLVVGLSNVDGWRMGVVVFAGLLLAVAPLFTGLFGGPLLVGAGVACWLAWAWLILGGNYAAGGTVGLGLGGLLWVAVYRYFVRADRRSSRQDS